MPKRRLQIRIDRELARRLAVHVALSDCTVSDCCEQIIRAYLERYGRGAHYFDQPAAATSAVEAADPSVP